MALTRRKNEDKEERREQKLKFSYDIAQALNLFLFSRQIQSEWCILEKGTDHSSKGEERTISGGVIRAAIRELREHILREEFFNYGNEIRSRKKYRHDILLIKGHIQGRGTAYALHQIANKGLYDGVVAFSVDGSFACALSYFGQKYNLNVTIVVSMSAYEGYIELCKIHQANLIRRDTNNPVDLHNAALNIARTRGLVYIDRHNHPDVVIGGATLSSDILDNILQQKSLNLEDFEQDATNSEMMQNLPSLEFAVLLPMAGTNSGLTVALAIALREREPDIKIYEIRPIRCDYGNLNVSKLTKSAKEVDGVEPNIYSWFSYDDLIKVFDDIFVVQNEDIRTQYQKLDRHCMDDIGAAICLAALESQTYRHVFQGKTLIVPVFGKMEWSPDFINDITLDPVSQEPDVAGPSNQ